MMRYRMLLSDGENSNSFSMLGTQLNPMIHSGQLEYFTIIRMDKYICNQVQGHSKRVIIPIEVSIVKPGNQVGEKIGSPQPMNEDGSTNVQNQNSSPNEDGASPALRRPNEQPPLTNYEAKKPMDSVQPRTSKLDQQHQSQDGNIGRHIEKLEKLNKEIGDFEKKYKDNLDIRKQRKTDLKRKHEEEQTIMKKRHKEEQTMLETTLVSEDQVEQRHMAILRERRDELTQDIQNKTNSPAQDTAGDHSKVEAAEKSLECPVCMDLMRPPTRIWMCRLSHIICESCKDVLHKKEDNRGKCPTCRTGQVNLRALMAENFARTIFNE